MTESEQLKAIHEAFQVLIGDMERGANVDSAKEDFIRICGNTFDEYWEWEERKKNLQKHAGPRATLGQVLMNTEAMGEFFHQRERVFSYLRDFHRCEHIFRPDIAGVFSVRFPGLIRGRQFDSFRISYCGEDLPFTDSSVEGDNLGEVVTKLRKTLDGIDGMPPSDFVK
jgi:hypothetical protein